MSDERGELLREIGAALTIEPSSSFAAGVRDRVAAESSPWGRRGLWWGVVGAAACAATIVAVIVANRSPVVPIAVAPDAASVAIAAARPSPVVEPRSAPVAPVVSKTPRRGAAPTQATRVATAGGSRLQVLVSPDEANALRRLLLAARSGRAQAAPGPVTIDPETGELLPIEAIVIPPIEPATQGGRDREGSRRE